MQRARKLWEESATKRVILTTILVCQCSRLGVHDTYYVSRLLPKLRYDNVEHAKEMLVTSPCLPTYCSIDTNRRCAR